MSCTLLITVLALFANYHNSTLLQTFRFASMHGANSSADRRSLSGRSCAWQIVYRTIWKTVASIMFKKGSLHFLAPCATATVLARLTPIVEHSRFYKVRNRTWVISIGGYYAIWVALAKEKDLGQFFLLSYEAIVRFINWVRWHLNHYGSSLSYPPEVPSSPCNEGQA